MCHPLPPPLPTESARLADSQTGGVWLPISARDGLLAAREAKAAAVDEALEKKRRELAEIEARTQDGLAELEDMRAEHAASEEAVRACRAPASITHHATPTNLTATPARDTCVAMPQTYAMSEEVARREEDVAAREEALEDAQRDLGDREAALLEAQTAVKEAQKEVRRPHSGSMCWHTRARPHALPRHRTAVYRGATAGLCCEGSESQAGGAAGKGRGAG